MASGINFLDALQTRMGWLSGRQKLVAENVANASTPGYKPRDLAAQNFDTLMKGQAEGGGKLGMATTNAAHLQIEGFKPNSAREVTALDSETTMDGNSVVLEEQMLKMAESRMQFDAAVGFYQKSLAMVRMAARPPGR
ncbi:MULTISPECIES: flagellar basal body rod protein FlgB [Asticcacaulis]|uniref:flagellar basal body rod protein FlgB n=1 Tax=Asticcacaulis TaxID=76890 RepID=UPI001AE2E55E|nr:MULTISPECIES: flagellar basal body rod protein FlgB [Asticcacaulis]MBP2157564.1 flagellar basal-body rod protein FlgB [Asticcacaulis solisilvae]MDR6798609.1 flagellar basal-body rod protein FlgB [Asticcacaulis sp. BE141]